LIQIFSSRWFSVKDKSIDEKNNLEAHSGSFPGNIAILVHIFFKKKIIKQLITKKNKTFCRH